MTDTADAARALRVLRVMETVARSIAPPTLAQLAARMHVPKSTMMRLVRDMQQDGWLVRVPHSRMRRQSRRTSLSGSIVFIEIVSPFSPRRRPNRAGTASSWRKGSRPGNTPEKHRLRVERRRSIVGRGLEGGYRER